MALNGTNTPLIKDTRSLLIQMINMSTETSVCSFINDRLGNKVFFGLRYIPFYNSQGKLKTLLNHVGLHRTKDSNTGGKTNNTFDNNCQWRRVFFFTFDAIVFGAI